jgi:hypothetical protein
MTRPAILITGAARRIGAAIARRFGEEGWHVVVHYGQSRDEAEALAGALPSAETIQCDLAEPAAAVAMVEALAERLPDWRVPTPPGGLFVWCALPSARSSALVLEAERVGVRLAAGPLFGTGHALEDRLRLPFAQEPEVLRRAVALLARADARASGVRDLPPVEVADVLTVS